MLKNFKNLLIRKLQNRNRQRTSFSIGKFSIAFGILILSVLISVLIFVGRDKLGRIEKTEDLNKSLEKKLMAEIFIEATKELQRRWRYGDIEGYHLKKPFECSEEIGNLKNVDDYYLRCNPNYMECYFQGKAGLKDPSIKVRLQGKTYLVYANRIYSSPSRYASKKRFYSIISRSTAKGSAVPSYGMSVSLGIEDYPGYEMEVVFENDCDDAYLPQRLFALGYQGNNYYSNLNILPEEEWEWDNFYRGIFIDKFLVSFRDIAEWVDYGHGDKTLWIPQNRSLWSKPAYGLTKDQMQRYCAFRGKHLAEAHIYDAASFLPGNLNDLIPIKVIRHPYPWTKKAQDSFLYEWGRTEISSKDCRLAYVKECFSLMPFEDFSTGSPTWIEVYQTLGGYLEGMRNPVRPNENLKASSFYFSGESKWHLLGRRAYWDGLNAREENIIWGEDDSNFEITTNDHNDHNDQLKIGFRCMKFSEGEN